MTIYRGIDVGDDEATEGKKDGVDALLTPSYPEAFQPSHNPTLIRAGLNLVNELIRNLGDADGALCRSADVAAIRLPTGEVAIYRLESVSRP